MNVINATDKKPAQSGLFADKSGLLREGERADDLQYKGLRLIQSPSAFCFGTDSILLTHFALPPLLRAKRDARVIDLGSGSGAITLLLAAKTGLSVTGVEIDAEQCERLERTLALNCLDRESTEENMRGIGKIEVVCADYLSPELSFERKFDHAVCNPPYFKVGSGGDPRNAGATHERSADVLSLAQAARRFLKFGGSFSLCFPAERLSEAFCALSANSLEPKILRLVRTKAGKKPYLALIRAKHGAKSGLTIENDLIIADNDGRYTEEVQRYYDGE